MPEVPQSLDSERSVLGVILIDETRLDQAKELTPEDFFLPAHSHIWTAMLDMRARGVPIDLVTLGEDLAEKNWLLAVGGPVFLSSLTDGMPRLDNIGHYVKVVKEKAEQRRMMQAGTEIAARAEAGDTAEVIELSKAIRERTSPNGRKEAEALIVPEGAWCDVAKQYLAAVGHNTSASSNYHFAVFLAVAGAILGRSIHCNAGELFPNFFIGLVGESSYAKKGTAMRYGKRLLRAVGSPVHWLMSVDSAAGFTKELATRQAEEKTKEIVCMLHFPELRSLIDKANREGSRDIIPKISEAYDCEDLQRVVVGGSGIASNTFTSLLGGAAPDWLTSLKESDLKGGLGNRFCWIPGEECEPLHKRPPISMRHWNMVVKSLHDCRAYWAGERGERLPTEFSLSPEADELMETYGKALYRDTRNEPLIRELVGRMENHCVKTALVYAAIDRTPVIEPFHLKKAILFCDFLLKGLHSIFGTFGWTEIVKQEQRILEVIDKAGGVMNQRTLQRQFPRMDGETFQRRLRWMIGEDNHLSARKEGRSLYLYLNR